MLPRAGMTNCLNAGDVGICSPEASGAWLDHVEAMHQHKLWPACFAPFALWAPVVHVFLFSKCFFQGVATWCFFSFFRSFPHSFFLPQKAAQTVPNSQRAHLNRRSGPQSGPSRVWRGPKDQSQRATLYGEHEEQNAQFTSLIVSGFGRRFTVLSHLLCTAALQAARTRDGMSANFLPRKWELALAVEVWRRTAAVVRRVLGT